MQVVSDQHPRSLLILDDVWSFDVARAFAIRCRTMVTSRNAAVANGIPTPQIHSVSVSEGNFVVYTRCSFFVCIIYTVESCKYAVFAHMYNVHCIKPTQLIIFLRRYMCFCLMSYLVSIPTMYVYVPRILPIAHFNNCTAHD